MSHVRIRLAMGVVCAGLLACLLPTAASARKPVIAYVEGGQFKLFDAELGQDVAAPSVPVPAAGFRFGISRNGRYVFFNDADKKLHLLDRQTSQQLPLPGIDIYANPAFLTVSDGGLLAFDQNVNGPTVVYDSKTMQFVNTGLAATNGNRQPQLSPGGGFLITTCNSAADCPTPTSGADPFLQDLTAKTNISLSGATDAAKDEEDPCIGAGGNLVGWQKPNPVQKDVLIWDRAANSFLALPNLNSATFDDVFCVLDANGDYIGLMSNNVFKLYQRSSGTFVPLPAKPFLSSNAANAIFSSPFVPVSAASPCAGKKGKARKRCLCKQKKNKHKRKKCLKKLKAKGRKRR
jgi:hypothetical protein